MGDGASVQFDDSSSAAVADSGSGNDDSAGNLRGVCIVFELQKLDDQKNLPGHLRPHVSICWDESEKSNFVEMKARELAGWELSQVLPIHSGQVSCRFSLVAKDPSISSCVTEESPNHIFDLNKDTKTQSTIVFKLDSEIHEFLMVASLKDEEPVLNSHASQPAQNGPAEQASPLTVPGKKSENFQNRSVSIKDLVLLGSDSSHSETETSTSPQTAASMSPEQVKTASRSIGTDPLTRFEDHQGLYVNRSVGNSPKLFRISSDISMLDGDSELEGKSEDMPEATGAVAAAAVSERMLLPKERRQIAIVLVGLPARGKTFTAVKLTRYLRWLGHDTKHFNVGKYRRLKHGCTQAADFFRGDNQEGVDARNEVAVLAMEDMLSWMEAGGQIGVFDATNSTKERRNMILRMAEGKCKVIFLETICSDQSIIDRNINLKIQQSPDYADKTDYNEALADFKARLENYEKVYETVDEGSYIKMIDTVTGQGGQIQVNAISGYLPGRIVFFLVNTHITPRPIFLTRHGESVYNLSGQIGGDPGLSESGEKYALKLASFIANRLKSESTASVWTSTLQRTILTAQHIVRFPKVQWRALDEINAGICDGMTYEEIGNKMPDEYMARKLDKLRYRYPRGESYLDVIQRLEPVIIELERQRAPVVVIAHQAVLRSLYAYFADKPLKEIPHIEVPLHTVIEIQMGVTGIQEKRYKLS